jgi:surface protein
VACNRVTLADFSKYRKKYPLVRNLSKTQLVANTGAEIENIIHDVPVLSDTHVITFASPFSGIPSVVANFISISEHGNVNVYVLSISVTSVTVRTSAPVIGKIAVQAIYIEGCPAVEVAPYVVVPPVLAAASTGSPVSCTAGLVAGIPAANSILYTLYIGGLPVVGYVGVNLVTINSYVYQVSDAGQSVFVELLATSPIGSTSVNSNTVTVALNYSPFVIYVDTTIQTANYFLPFSTPPSATNEYRFMGVGQFDIDWGDGNIDYGVTGLPGIGTLHTYALPGQYEISVSNWSDAGDGIAIQTYSQTFPNPPIVDGDCIKLLEIRAWGSTGWTSMLGSFTACENMVGTFTDAPDLSACNSTSLMFAGCLSFNTNIDSWNVSSVTSMAAMFADAAIYNQPMNSWDVSSVITMQSMFIGQQVIPSFNQPLNNWDVSSVVNMETMFYFAAAFDQQLGDWILNDSVDMSLMLSNCGMSPNNYSQTLVGWANEASLSGTPTNASLGAAGLVYNSQVFTGSPYTYAAGVDIGGPAGARDFLVTTQGWTISGDSP